MMLNLADYSRYLCEFTIEEQHKPELIKETENYYVKFISAITEVGMSLVNPCSLTGYYHFGIFMFEIQDKKVEAIRYMKTKHQEIVSNLDYSYKYFIDSYQLIDLITDTLTIWVINTNYGNINNRISNGEE